MADDKTIPSQMTDMDEDQKVRFTRDVIAILDEWQVKDSEQVALLGLPEDTRTRQIRSFRQGSSVFPEDDSRLNEYLDHLLGIDDALRTSNPCNSAAGGMWMNRINNRFKDRTPINAMLEDGIIGIVAVRIHLDCAYDWHISS